MKLMQQKILQIIPASGWKLQLNADCDFERRVVCFALVEITEDDGSIYRDVLPMLDTDIGIDCMEEYKLTYHP